MRYNPNQRCYKYILIGRRQTIKNLDGDDKVKLITEIFRQVIGSAEGGIVEYKRAYYRELIGGRGCDTSDSGRSYLSMDRTAGEFVEIAYGEDDALDSNEIVAFRTYKNQNFLNRDRSTTFHHEVDIKVKVAP